MSECNWSSRSLCRESGLSGLCECLVKCRWGVDANARVGGDPCRWQAAGVRGHRAGGRARLRLSAEDAPVTRVKESRNPEDELSEDESSEDESLKDRSCQKQVGGKKGRIVAFDYVQSAQHDTAAHPPVRR